MTYEQMKILEEKTRQMHHELANTLMAIGLVRENFDTFSPEKKASHEANWQTAYLKVFESLSTCLEIFDTQ